MDSPLLALIVMVVLNIAMGGVCIKQFADLSLREQSESLIKIIGYMIFFALNIGSGVLLYNAI